MEVYASEGFVFAPKEWEILDYFLRSKVNRVDLPKIYDNILHEVDLYGDGGQHPRNLFNANEQNYVFTRLIMLSANKVNRQVKGGLWTWRPDKSVNVRVGGRVLGKKRSLSLMEGAECTHWNMDEYRLPDWKDGDWVFCCVRYSKKNLADATQEARVEDGAKRKSIGDGTKRTSIPVVEAQWESTFLEFAPVPRTMHEVAPQSADLVPIKLFRAAPQAVNVPRNMHGVAPPSTHLVPRNMFQAAPEAVYVPRNVIHEVAPALDYAPQPQEYNPLEPQLAHPLEMEDLAHGMRIAELMRNQLPNVQHDPHEDAMEGFFDNMDACIAQYVQQVHVHNTAANVDHEEFKRSSEPQPVDTMAATTAEDTFEFDSFDMDELFSGLSPALPQDQGETVEDDIFKGFEF